MCASSRVVLRRLAKAKIAGSIPVSRFSTPRGKPLGVFAFDRDRTFGSSRLRLGRRKAGATGALRPRPALLISQRKILWEFSHSTEIELSVRLGYRLVSVPLRSAQDQRPLDVVRRR